MHHVGRTRNYLVPLPSSLKVLSWKRSILCGSYNDSLNRLKKWRSYTKTDAIPGSQSTVCRRTSKNIGRRSDGAFFPKVARRSGRSISPVNLLFSFVSSTPKTASLPPPALFVALVLSWLHSCSRNSFCLRVLEDRGASLAANRLVVRLSVA